MVKGWQAMRHFWRLQITAYAMLGLLYGLASAQTPAIVKALQNKYGKKAALQTQFSLEIFWKVREKIEKKSGMLYCAPGDKFRLALDKTTWVSDGRTYWQYNEKSNQAVIKQLLDIDLSMHPSQIIATYLFEYAYRIKEESGNEAVVLWTAPEDDNKAFAKSVTLWIDKKKLVLKKLHIVDASGNESTYTFKKTKTNAKIPPGTFTLKIPEGVSVLDTRE
jgi:outer membrane lipoprotein carrier protein